MTPLPRRPLFRNVVNLAEETSNHNRYTLPLYDAFYINANANREISMREIFERESRSRGIAVSAPEPVPRPSMPFPRLVSLALPFPSLPSSVPRPPRRSLLHFFHQKRFR